MHSVEYESNGDGDKTLSAEEYLNQIIPYLKNIINNLQKSDTGFISYDKADKVIEEHFQLCLSGYQIGLET